MQTIDFIGADKKTYIQRENVELMNMIKSLREIWFITDRQFELNYSEICDWLPLSSLWNNMNHAEQVEKLSAFGKIVWNTKTDISEWANGNKIITKYESENPFGSHYDRVNFSILEKLLKKKWIERVLELSSGSMGISIAWIVSYILWKETLLITPETQYPIRYSLAQRLGAKIHLTTSHMWITGASEVFWEHWKRLRKEWYIPLNHSDSHWDVIEPAMKETVSEVQERIDIALLIKWNGTSALWVGNWILEENPDATIYGVRYIPDSSGSSIQIPWSDKTSIDFPRLNEFEALEAWKITIQQGEVTHYAQEHELWLSSALSQLAAQKLLSEWDIQCKNILTFDYDSFRRY